MRSLSDKQYSRVTSACLAGGIISAVWFDYGWMPFGAIALGVSAATLAVCAYFCQGTEEVGTSAAIRTSNQVAESVVAVEPIRFTGALPQAVSSGSVSIGAPFVFGGFDVSRFAQAEQIVF